MDEKEFTYGPLTFGRNGKINDPQDGFNAYIEMVETPDVWNVCNCSRYWGTMSPKKYAKLSKAEQVHYAKTMLRAMWRGGFLQHELWDVDTFNTLIALLTIAERHAVDRKGMDAQIIEGALEFITNPTEIYPL